MGFGALWFRCAYTATKDTASKAQCSRKCASDSTSQRPRTMPYNTQSNGAVQQVHRALITLLRTLYREKPKTWDHRLFQVVFAHNTTSHRPNGVSHSLLVHGDAARLPGELLTASPTEAESVNEFGKKLLKRSAPASERARVASNRNQNVLRRNITTQAYTRECTYAETWYMCN